MKEDQTPKIKQIGHRKPLLLTNYKDERHKINSLETILVSILKEGNKDDLQRSKIDGYKRIPHCNLSSK